MRFNKNELLSAALMLTIGIGTVIGSLNYDIRSLARMGPGYFPLMLGIGLIIIGALILATPSTPEDESAEIIGEPQYRAWGFVTASVVLFIILGKYGGLLPATFVLVFLSALGDRTNTLFSAAALGAAMVVFALIVFHYGLRMQFPLFTWG